MSKRRVVLTGIGMVTSVGIGTEETWTGLCEGRSGIAPITRFDASTFATKFAGELKGFDPTRWISSREVKQIDPFIQYAIAAGAIAMEDAGIKIEGEFAERVGCFVGAGLGGITHHRSDQDVAEREGAALRHLALLRAPDHHQLGARAAVDPSRRQGPEHEPRLGVLVRRARHRRSHAHGPPRLLPTP